MDAVVVLGGDGGAGGLGERYVRGRDLVLAGFSKRLIVLNAGDPPHMLRLRYTWGSVLRGSGIDYTLVATAPPWWPGWRWWRNPEASGFVGNEVLKLGYYVVRYRFGW